MIVRTLADALGTEREVSTPNWTSRRMLLAADGAGFSLHDTLIRAGTETSMWYRHHVEAVYCIEGLGEVEVIDEGARHQLRPGTLYVLDGHEKHVVRAHEDLRMVCIFNPPCTGNETHDEHGTYPLLCEEATT
ncbi:MAG TPA: ectoine synthase [Acidimicrobiales bacterium]|jgi:L-ectoine synthase|nr:ectoine synthase [Acidimicrobiales bacterium]